ncbi:HAMP domain-containing protein [Gordonia pseudamarae]|mgnify:CR=1 FL=1|uniref:histidine kinase n=1 Tax=Gordonia pseudamarae TaxID=2831662 RepID=A0ABX6IKW8_9ACTN|nr:MULTISPECIES: HAMP domain-containing sensor histidine kinase [Gordonia]MBD0020635.1 HAMP domain-containing protein [Gordonia sp. (in: high G+C Gram-positive bacteria)]QHN27680.1 HAMP domain-containing protein [Gordonia pseudamarae]QHN36562.1 HAMP domain-containing protein [Gordonia pseudamarae]
MSSAADNRRPGAGRWLGPVRIRLTLVATAVVTVAMAVAAIGMLLTMHRSLIADAESAGANRARQLADALEADGLHAITPLMLARDPNVADVVIIDADGEVEKSSVVGVRPLLASLPPGSSKTVRDIRVVGRYNYTYTANAVGVDTPNGPLTVIVSTDQGPITTSVLTVAYTICMVFPGIIIGVALLTYFLVGRALRPVESIRKQADAISGGDTSRRLTVPATGDEIAGLASTMNEMLERIEHSRSRQLQFVNDASHELNSPLTTIIGLLDLARTTGQPIDIHTIETILLPDAHRLGQLVEDLLILARADEKGMRTTPQSVDLDDIVRSEVTRMRALSPADVSSAIVAARVDGDPGQLTRAVRNIADNAARHTRSTLSFAISRDDRAGTVTVSVADNGPGVADADKTRVFDRFVRLDAARDRDRGGSGLGLAIVADIVRAHGGTVVAEDNPGGGAVFAITLPLAAATAGTPGQTPPHDARAVST